MVSRACPLGGGIAKRDPASSHRLGDLDVRTTSSGERGFGRARPHAPVLPRQPAKRQLRPTPDPARPLNTPLTRTSMPSRSWSEPRSAPPGLRSRAAANRRHIHPRVSCAGSDHPSPAGGSTAHATTRSGLDPRGGSVLRDCSYVRSHSLSSSRATPIEGPGRLGTMTSNERHHGAEGAARRRGGLHRADGDRRVGQAVKARHDLATRGVGRAWINGREVGGADPRYTHLEASHD